MKTIYFDITDIVRHVERNTTVVGIPRVQLNVITRLSKKYGGAVIRCTFFDYRRNAMFEFDPSERAPGFEFDGQALLRELGLARASSVVPSKSAVKSYLLPFKGRKVWRAIKRAEIYLSALLIPQRLRDMGLLPAKNALAATHKVVVTKVTALPMDSSFVCLGAIWLLNDVWQFARAHRSRGGDVVQMIHDLVPLNYPHYYSQREAEAFSLWLEEALQYASRFICNSDWTAGDFTAFAKARASKQPVRAIRLAHEFIGFDRTSRVTAPMKYAHLVAVSFVLCVGTIEFRKNNLALLKVWRELLVEFDGKGPLLVFAGKLGKGGQEFQAELERDEQLQRFVRIEHAPTDYELAWLYQNCVFTAYPSQFEGWGLPVGESAWFGRYCVASYATSIPEVCGELLEYVDPNDIKSILQGVLKPLHDPKFLREREHRIANMPMRTWADVADDVYDFVANPGVSPG